MDPHSGVRQEAAWALGTLAERIPVEQADAVPQVARALRKRLKDPDTDVADSAYQALKRLADRLSALPQPPLDILAPPRPFLSRQTIAVLVAIGGVLLAVGGNWLYDLLHLPRQLSVIGTVAIMVATLLLAMLVARLG